MGDEARGRPQFRTPLSVARGLGSARSGTGHFIAQRVTAIILIPFTLWFVYSLLDLAATADRVAVINWLSSGVNAASLVILLLALFYHAQIGIQVILEDYVHCPYLKMTSVLANAFIMFAFATISVIAVLKLHLIS